MQLELSDRQRAAVTAAVTIVAAAIILVAVASVFWLVKLTTPFFSVGELDLSWRDLIMIGGGMFLLGKATLEIHSAVEGEEHNPTAKTASGLFYMVIAQIVALDVIFSLDSVLTAVGLTDEYIIMAAAITLAILVMIFLAKPLSGFVERLKTVAHSTVSGGSVEDSARTSGK